MQTTAAEPPSCTGWRDANWRVLVMLAVVPMLGGCAYQKPPAFSGTAANVFPLDPTGVAAARLYASDGALVPSGYASWFRFASDGRRAGQPVYVATILMIASPHDTGAADEWSTVQGDLRAWLVEHDEPVAEVWRDRRRQDEGFRSRAVAFATSPSHELAPGWRTHSLDGTVRPRDPTWRSPEMDVDLSSAAGGAERRVAIRGTIRSPDDVLMNLAWPVLAPVAVLAFFPPLSWFASHP